MSVVNATPLLLGDDGYNISRSVRLRSSASAYFNRTPAVSGSSTTWTWSGWVERGALGGAGAGIFYAGVLSTSNDETGFQFRGDDTLQIFQNNGASTVLNKITSSVYRDPSAWYHFVLTFDTTNATAEDRVRLYVNGVRVTSFSSNTNISQNATTYVNSTSYGNRIFRDYTTGYLDGYLTEVNFIDGQALTPSSFGETDAVTGVWKPKKYAGTYGTNGFYLNFSDNSSNTATTIGKDSSGNGNNWTPNNISVTAGSTYDSMIDVPTPYADGGNGRGNYCVLNPVFKNANATYGVMATPIDGNLNATSIGAGTNVYGSIDLFGNKGKWYAECRASSIVSQVSIGFLSDDGNLNRGAWINSSSGVLVDNVSKSTSGFASGNTVGIAYDSINNTVQFYVNNSAVGSAYTTSTGSFSSYLFWSYTNSGVSLEWNFGQRPFAYTPPTGFKALNTQNLPDATIKKGGQYMAATLWTGTGVARDVTGVGFQPDLVWLKIRSSADSHGLFDSVRGAGKRLQSNDTGAEATTTAVQSAFISDGFTVGTDAQSNGSGSTYVGWSWKESASAGFDIVTYTGTGSATTVAHSLGVAPKMMVVKSRSAVTNWAVFHSSTGSNGLLNLNGTAAVATDNNVFNATPPTSSVFSVGVSSLTNTNSATYVAYLFAEVAGYSKFGSYTGNGSTDGPFVYCGFRPKFVLWKRSDSTSDWNIIDTTRDTYNYADKELFPNLSTAETVIGGGLSRLDMLSNGFKVRGADSYQNANGGTYIFMALAENPFKNSLAR